ncbi:MAG TPA: hypothetical protein VD903_20520 [Pseudonocardia sp.]|nr:hypothetical protein [Pseudonocardia sp.]
MDDPVPVCVGQGVTDMTKHFHGLAGLERAHRPVGRAGPSEALFDHPGARYFELPVMHMSNLPTPPEQSRRRQCGTTSNTVGGV